VTEKLVNAASSVLERRTSRRGFLARAATVGSALAIAPLRYLLYPEPAAAHLQSCPSGTRCRDGFSEFCVSITGSNTCPSNTFIGGYWKCSSYTGGGLCRTVDRRYYIDCNLKSGYTTGCHCANHDCNCRRTGCNNFQYGNCNSQIAYLNRPVICRRIMCHNPAQDYSFCSYNVKYDSRTCGHHACRSGTTY